MSKLRLLSGQPLRIVLFSSLFLLAACGEEPKQQGGAGMKVPVSVVTVQPASADVYVVLPGRVEAIKDAQIRARVTGIVNEVNFKQGSEVEKGQLLFTIDSAPYKAVREQAAAQLLRAEADAKAARSLSQRYAKLIKENAISRQEYDNAQAQTAQANASIAAAQASLQSSDIDLGYTKIVSPISGRIGKSLVTEGALVSAGNATLLANVQQLDNVYVDLTRSTMQLTQLRRALASGELTQTPDGAAFAQVLLEDGSIYKDTGKLLFSGVSVDPGTGQVSLRAEFSNPDQILLPGMYVRVRLQQGVDAEALLVPQQAIQRTADGLNSLIVVKDGAAQPVPVTVGSQIDGSSIITKGLNAGDVVVVEGFQKIRPGAPVQPIPWKGQQGQQNQQGGQPDQNATAADATAPTEK